MRTIRERTKTTGSLLMQCRLIKLMKKQLILELLCNGDSKIGIKSYCVGAWLGAHYTALDGEITALTADAIPL